MEIIYRPKRERLVYSIFIYCVFIGLGVLIFVKADYIATFQFSRIFGLFGTSPSFQIIGILSVLIFILMIIGTINIFIQNYILKINEKGFENNTNFTNVGLIEWEDVLEISLMEKQINGYILIHVKNKEIYFKRIKNPLIRWNAMTYSKYYKTSFLIETQHLSIFDFELFDILQKYKNTSKN